MIETLEQHALKLLISYPQIQEIPASISGKYHSGETLFEHLQTTANIMKHLCDEFAIEGESRDILVAAAWLHDIGNCGITIKGNVEEPGWNYFPATGYSRHSVLYFVHPILSTLIISASQIPNATQINDIVITHMSHWSPRCPQPITFEQKLLCTADYIASKGEKIFNEPTGH